VFFICRVKSSVEDGPLFVGGRLFPSERNT
jgi:hypothetical protein